MCILARRDRDAPLGLGLVGGGERGELPRGGFARLRSTALCDLRVVGSLLSLREQSLEVEPARPKKR